MQDVVAQRTPKRMNKFESSVRNIRKLLIQNVTAIQT